MTVNELITVQLGRDSIVIPHAGGTVTLTPEQAKAVLAGGELVDVLGKAVVK